MKTLFKTKFNKKMIALLCAITVLAGIINVPTTVKAEASEHIVVSNITSSSCYVDWSRMAEVVDSSYVLDDYSVVVWWSGIPTQTDIIKYEHTRATSGTIDGIASGDHCMVTVYVYMHKADDPSNTSYDLEFVEFDTLAGSSNGTGTPEIVAPGITEPVPTPAPTPVTPVTPATPGTVDEYQVPGAVNPVYSPYVSYIKMVGNKVGVVVANTTNYGTEVYLYNNSGKLIDQTTTYDGTAIFYGVPRNNIYYVMVYNRDENYNRSIAVKSDSVMAQPKISENKSKTKRNSIKLKWNKVSGAKKYVIYAKKASSKTWTKIGTTSKTAFTFNKLKGKRIDTYYSTYHIKVVAVNGKLKSDSSNYVEAYTY